jgi:hypothetical protein
MRTRRLLPSLTSEIIHFRLRQMSGSLTQSDYALAVPKRQHNSSGSILFTTGKLRVMHPAGH